MKADKLKLLVKEIARRCMTEAGASYKVNDGSSNADTPGMVNKAREMQENPNINEVAPPGFGPDKEHSDIYKKVKDQYKGNPEAAYATMWKIHNSMKESAMMYLEQLREQEEAEGYSEEEEIKLIKALGAIILKLLKMHKGQEEGENALPRKSEAPEGEAESSERVDEKEDKWIQKAINPKHKGWCTPLSNPHCTGPRRALARRFQHGLEELSACFEANEVLEEAGASYKINNGKSDVEAPGKVNRARQNQEDPSVKENHKVQHRSYKTIDDVDQNPKNLRDPEVPN